MEAQRPAIPSYTVVYKTNMESILSKNEAYQLQSHAPFKPDWGPSLEGER